MSIPPTEDSSRRRKARTYALAGVLALAAAFAGWRYWHGLTRYEGQAGLQVDLRNPDGLLATRNLAEVPADVAAAPALTGLVDEELVFHYEEDEARRSLEGTLRRLAYEHDLDLQDRFLATLLAEPAEIAFWRSAKGRPEHFIATMERGVLSRLAEAFARIALADGQLRLAGKFALGGDDVPLYTLNYGSGRTLAFAGMGDRWVILSDPRLALNTEGALSSDGAEILKDLLHGEHPWQDALPHDARAKHSLVIAPQAITLDYGRFLPALTGLRFDNDGSGWKTSLRIDRSKLSSEPDVATIWRSVPLGAALCVTAPVQWSAVAAPLEKLLDGDRAIRPVLAALDPITAACWYPDSRLAAPLFVARATQTLPPDASELLARLAQKAWSTEAVPSADQGDGNRRVHSATLVSRHGVRSANGHERAFPVALARHENLILFSPDGRKVDAALAVAAKRAPALADEAGLKDPAWLAYDPGRLAQLIRAEVQEVLPADEESYFREIARNRLWPRLETWGKTHPARIAVPAASGGDGFVSLDFRPLKEAGH